MVAVVGFEPTPPERLEKLTSIVTCLTEERDRLQKELTSAQERTRTLEQEVDLNTDCKQLDELKNKNQMALRSADEKMSLQGGSQSPPYSD